MHYYILLLLLQRIEKEMWLFVINISFMKVFKKNYCRFFQTVFFVRVPITFF